jgi:hypothetical protein
MIWQKISIMIWRTLRIILRVPPRTLSPEEARAIARAECGKRGYLGFEPFGITENLRDFVVWTRSDSMAGIVLIEVDNRTGLVKSVGLPPR